MLRRYFGARPALAFVTVSSFTRPGLLHVCGEDVAR